jgi:hypothetical protein
VFHEVSIDIVFSIVSIKVQNINVFSDSGIIQFVGVSSKLKFPKLIRHYQLFDLQTKVKKGKISIETVESYGIFLPPPFLNQHL